jgi:predicted permease
MLGHAMSGSSYSGLPGDRSADRSADKLTVGDTFFDTMRIPLRLGRGLTAADVSGASKVVVVNDAFVRAYLPGVHPIGQTMKEGDTLLEIVGVCGDTLYTDLKGTPPPTVYYTFRQNNTGAAYFAVRTTLPPLAIVGAARKAVAAIDPDVPLADITTQEALRDENITQERMFATLCGSLAALAVLLACIGLYGLMAFNVTRRTGEIGVRLALGAQQSDISRPILREALLLAAAGLALGVPTALALAQLIKNQLFGVAPADPLTLIAGTVLLFAVATFASWLPARRASRVDPMIALRAE